MQTSAEQSRPFLETTEQIGHGFKSWEIRRLPRSPSSERQCGPRQKLEPASSAWGPFTELWNFKTTPHPKGFCSTE